MQVHHFFLIRNIRSWHRAGTLLSTSCAHHLESEKAKWELSGADTRNTGHTWGKHIITGVVVYFDMHQLIMTFPIATPHYNHNTNPFKMPSPACIFPLATLKFLYII